MLWILSADDPSHNLALAIATKNEATAIADRRAGRADLHGAEGTGGTEVAGVVELGVEGVIGLPAVPGGAAEVGEKR